MFNIISIIIRNINGCFKVSDCIRDIVFPIAENDLCDMFALYHTTCDRETFKIPQGIIR